MPPLANAAFGLGTVRLYHKRPSASRRDSTASVCATHAERRRAQENYCRGPTGVLLDNRPRPATRKRIQRILWAASDR